MLHKSPRRRSPASGSRRKTKPPHPSPSPSRRTNNNNKKWSRPHRHRKILKRCSSAPPVLLSRGRSEDDDDAEFGRYMSWTQSTLFRPKTFSDAFLSSSPSLFPSSPLTHSAKGYDKEAKVVVNVTVEGSPGPVRTMVKLGSTVGDTIRRVVDIYKEQGRSPKLDDHKNNNLDLPSTFQLHQSYFSLQSLEKSEIIGDVGSRSFYLRKSNGPSASNSFHSEIGIRGSVPSNAIANPPLLLPSFLARKISKIARRAKRLWNMVVCSQ